MYLLTHNRLTVAFYDQESGKGHQLKSFGLVKIIFDTTTDTQHLCLVPDNKSIIFSNRHHPQNKQYPFDYPIKES